MRRRTLALASLIAATFTLTSCGSDSTGNSGDALTADEASALASEFLGLLQGIDIPLFEALPSPAASPAAVPYGDLYDPVIDVNEACDGGGNATIGGTISGDVDSQTYAADINVTATAGFASCGVVSQSSTITVSGNPDVQISGHVVFDPDQESASIDLGGKGSVTYETNDGRSGTCAVDLSANASLTSVSGLTQSVTGTMCGADASKFDLVLIQP